MFQKKDVWVMFCKTGCTCCSDENFAQGFFNSAEEAQALMDEYLQGIGNPLTSQFSKYGRYSIAKYEAEILPDGRMIVGDRIYDQSDYIEKLDWDYV